MKDTSRDNSIDFLRTLAIFLMVFAHTNMLLRVATNPINDVIQNLGNTICFALFLFCAGASLYYSKRSSWQGLLKRTWLLYIAYFIASALFLIETRNFHPENLLRILFLLELPGYAEFIIAFILYDILYFLLKDQINLISKSFWKVVIFGSITFFIGTIFANSGYHNFLTHLIYGQKDIFSFPVLQYFIFFLAGLYYSNYKNKETVDIMAIFLLVLIFGWIYFMFYFFNYDFINMYYRWPPSGLYITGNLFILSILLLLTHLFEKVINKYQILFKIPSQYAFHLFYIHLMVLYLLRWAGIGGWIILSYVLSLAIVGVPFALNYAKIKTQKN